MSFKSNITKAIRYFKKNGIINTVYASIERVFFPYYKDYTYIPPSDEELKKQKTTKFSEDILFSVVVPTYETNAKHLQEMIDSVLSQSYGKFELILADASQSDSVEKTVETYTDSRIVYHKLEKNSGISDNTNEGIKLAKGDYIALLDHDDLLTHDALYCVMCEMEKEKKQGKEAKLIFSDEDKCDGEGKKFFEPHYKLGYNKALLFTNNYICHFLVSEAKMMKELLLRAEFDGAQDFDYVLRATSYVNKQKQTGEKVSICHVAKILYHWRCHENSTAQNPESKMYAYEAGKRAVSEALKEEGSSLFIAHEKHLGFYRIEVTDKAKLFSECDKLGCIGGAVYKGKKIISGAMDLEGQCLYNGLHKKFSGYMNRAHLMQNVHCVDIRNITVRKELWKTFEETTKLPYVTKSDTDLSFDLKKAIRLNGRKDKIDYKALSVVFCEKIVKDGYEIIYWET